MSAFVQVSPSTARLADNNADAAPAQHAAPALSDRHPDAFAPCGRTAKAYREAMAVLADGPWGHCTNVANLPLAQAVPSPAAAAQAQGAPSWLQGLQVLERMCQTALSALVASPLRTGITSGVVLGAAIALGPAMGVSSVIGLVHAVAPYCAITALLQWLTTPNDDSGPTVVAQRLAVAGIGLPIGATLGGLLGAAAGLSGLALVAAAGGGAAAMLGAAFLVHDVARSRAGFLLIVLGTAALGARAALHLLS